MNTVSTLPKILYMTGTTDAGDASASCPHCGATGRYIYWFRCEDGVKRGAMAGCVQLFPRSPLADEYRRIVDRQRSRARKGQKLASWDTEKLAAIEAFGRGELSEPVVRDVISAANARRSAYMESRGYRR